MLKKSKQINTQEDTLYNNIVLLSRNKIFYTKFSLTDTFQNRIHLIFIHMSFIFIKINQKKKEQIYKVLYQKIFDLIFKKIEINMREIGFGDVTVNKNMKFLVKNFYNILLCCENYNIKNLSKKNIFFNKYLEQNNTEKNTNNTDLIKYFNKYETFCFGLSADSVLKGDLKFNYI